MTEEQAKALDIALNAAQNELDLWHMEMAKNPKKRDKQIEMYESQLSRLTDPMSIEMKIRGLTILKSTIEEKNDI